MIEKRLKSNLIDLFKLCCNSQTIAFFNESDFFTDSQRVEIFLFFKKFFEIVEDVKNKDVSMKECVYNIYLSSFFINYDCLLSNKIVYQLFAYI